MKLDISKTLKVLFLGLLIYFILMSIPILILTQNKLNSELGLLLGTVVGGLMAVHMEIMINRSMYMDKHQAVFFATNTLLRLVLIGTIIIMAAWTRWVNPYTLLLGMIGLKLSAYIEPSFQRKIEKLKEGR